MTTQRPTRPAIRPYAVDVLPETVAAFVVLLGPGWRRATQGLV